MQILRNIVKAFLNLTLTPLVALLLVFEEWGWEPLARTLGRLNQLPFWARLERWIAELPPYAALATFGVPAITLLPVKLLALYWAGHGHLASGVLVVVIAKIAGTAMVARLFQLTQPSLMQMAWFARLYARWKTFKDALLARVRNSAIWRLGRVVKRQAKRIASRLWRGLRGAHS